MNRQGNLAKQFIMLIVFPLVVYFVSILAMVLVASGVTHNGANDSSERYFMGVNFIATVVFVVAGYRVWQSTNQFEGARMWPILAKFIIASIALMLVGIWFLVLSL